MLKPMETKNDDELLSEADELLRQIHSDVLNDVEAAHRLEFEKHAQNLKGSRPRFRKVAKRRARRKRAPMPIVCTRRSWTL